MKIERQLQGTLNTIFTELIKEKELEGRIMPYPVIEEGRADITLKNKNGKPIFFIELKDPTAKDGKSVFDSSVLMREVERAQRLEIKYFGNCNFLACAFFDKDKLFEKVSVNEGFFTLNDIFRLSQSYTPGKEILTKLRTIAGFYIERALEIIERKPIKFSDLDELFIFKIRKLIEVYSHSISNKVWDKYKHNKTFEKEIQQYTQSQLWNKPTTFEEIENLTHIGMLMLISKLIFYKAYVDNKTWDDLYPMKVPDSINSPDELEELIWKYFEKFQEVTRNFELLIGNRSDIIFKIPFVSDAVIDLVKEILDTEGHYNFSKIPFDIIGRIFEELIREDERHKLGQYFTPPHVIDFINAFAIHKSNDKVFDPSCGSGTFLVRAYERKKLLCAEEDKGARHEILLDEIYGNDLSGYPVYLSMLNLAIRNMRRASYPRIINKDFFAIYERSSITLHNQKGDEEKRLLPKFDAIIGNPPYTRQEDIGTMHGTVGKAKIQTLIKQECGFEPSQRTSIYAYFFYHASVFLKDRGYLAFICQNSWLDTNYGIDMQRYLLRNYEIVAIMDSEVERFFPSASVNTTIVIARKQRDEEARNANTIKFIYLTATLADTIKNYKGVNKLYDIIQCTNESESNDYYRINCIHQASLEKQTKLSQYLKAPQVYFDILEKGENKFVPLKNISKIRRGFTTGCNDYFYGEDITEILKDEFEKVIINNTENITSYKKLLQLGLRVFKNGLGECWLIEEQFLKPIITSAREIKKYEVLRTDLKFVALCVDLVENFIKESTGNIRKKYDISSYIKNLRQNYPYLFSYIKYGEKHKFGNETVSQKSSCITRPAWWDLNSKAISNLSYPYIIGAIHKVPKNNIALVDCNLFDIYAPKNLTYYLAGILNSYVFRLFIEMTGREMTGALTVKKVQVYELEDLLVPTNNVDKKKHQELEAIFRKMADDDALSIFDEIGSNNPDDVDLSKVKKLRFELDSKVLEIIGYKNKDERDNILLQVYQSLINVIQKRLDKSKSVEATQKTRSKVEFSVYVEQLKEMLVEGKYEAKKTLKFAKELEKLIREITSESKLQKKILDAYWKEKFKETYNEKKIADSTQIKLF